MIEEAKKIYDESIVIDACAPLASYKNEYRRYLEGGLTAIAASLLPSGGYLPETIKGLEGWYKRFRKDDRLLEVLTVDDIYRAKQEGKLGVILAFQGTTHLQADLTMLEVYYRLGLRQIQICYNSKNAIGDGCAEPGNGGLSVFGEKAIKEMNRLGILVDLSHTGYRTTMEAMEVCEKPCVFSHGNAYGVHPTMRNLRDEQVIKVAKLGGTVGVNGYPDFLSNNPKPKVDVFIDHIDYYVKMLGIDHVALGLDYYKTQHGIMTEEEAMRDYEDMLEEGLYSKEAYPSTPPYFYPEEIELPEKMPNLVPALQARGYADSDIKKILGENLIRVLKEVWK